MKLADSLIKKFATIVNEDNTEKTNDTYFGTTVVDSNGTYVKLDGSTELTPVSLATDAKANDRVIVSITDHKARVTINLTNPASGYSASDLYDEVTETGILAASKIFADTLDIHGKATADSISVNSLSSLSSNLGTITAGSININNKFIVNSLGEIDCGESFSVNSDGLLKTKHIIADEVSIAETYVWNDEVKDYVPGIGTTSFGVGKSGLVYSHNTDNTQSKLLMYDEGATLYGGNGDVHIGAFDALVTLELDGGTVVFQVGEDGTSKYIRSLPTYNRAYSSAANIYITSYGTFGRSTASSKRWKNSIKTVSDSDLNPDNLYNLDVRQFKFNTDYLTNKEDDRYDTTVIGLIAEEVNKVYPIAVSHSKDENGNIICEDWDVRYLVPAMLALIQEQNERLKKLEASNA